MERSGSGRISRRSLLSLMAVGSAGALLAACQGAAPAPAPAPKPTEAPAVKPAAQPTAAPAAAAPTTAPAAKSAATLKPFFAGERLLRTTPFQVLVVRAVLDGYDAD